MGLPLPAVSLGGLGLGQKKRLSRSAQGEPRHTRTWRLRTRLSIALFFVFVPIFALVIYSNAQALKDRRESRVSSLETIDETIGAVAEGFTRDLQSFALSTALTLGEVGDAGGTIVQEGYSQYFADLSAAYGVRTMFVTDLDGNVIAGPSGGGANIADRPYSQG